MKITKFKKPDSDRVAIYSMVDVLYYIRSYNWHSVANSIARQVPVGSYLLVADSLRRTQYRYFYRQDTNLVGISQGRSQSIVSQSLTESGKVFRRWLNWSIYKKVGSDY